MTANSYINFSSHCEMIACNNWLGSMTLMRSLDPLLRLDDARGGDELHRLRDLLRRLHRLDPPAVLAKLGTHLDQPCVSVFGSARL